MLHLQKGNFTVCQFYFNKLIKKTSDMFSFPETTLSHLPDVLYYMWAGGTQAGDTSGYTLAPDWT